MTLNYIFNELLSTDTNIDSRDDVSIIFQNPFRTIIPLYPEFGRNLVNQLQHDCQTLHRDNNRTDYKRFIGPFQRKRFSNSKLCIRSNLNKKDK